MNLQAANYMYRRFQELGIPVAITRSDDRTLTRDERVNTMVQSFGNGRDVLVLSNHINSGGGEGAEVFYPLRDNGALARMILEEIGSEGQIVRGAFQRRLPEDPSKDYYYIQRLTPNTTALLLEYGFIDNANDLRKLQSNLLNYVEAVVRAVAEYADVPYTAPGGTTTTPSESTYIVQSGDNLYSIARKYNTTVDALMSANNLTSTLLRVGQRLRIPSTTSSDINIYTVQLGDSLYSIARRYNTTVDSLMDANGLTSTLLQVGQILKVPSIDESIEQNPNTYVVQRGDTLYKIASQYGISVNDIIRANNLSSNVLKIGQALIIPTSGSSSQVYVVQNGDTLYKIANQFGVSIADLIQFNQLPSTVLQLGQEINIPSR